MAAVTIAADVVRIAEGNIVADSGTWGNDIGGGGIADEPDVVYQGTTSQSRKVSTSLRGRNYTHSATTSMTATGRRHYIAKINATNYGALVARTAPALNLKLGDSTSIYYTYYLFGNDNYPAKGGWQILAISPNVTGYRDTTTGSPNLAAVAYWSLLGDFSATSKSENVIIDAIDIGRGLCLTGGDGADPDGTFADFVEADEGTVGNRWGFLTSDSGILFPIGQLAIGEDASGTAVTSVFTDTTGAVLVWGNGLVESGFHKLLFNLDLLTATVTGATFDSIGKIDNDAGRGYTTTEDSRLVVEVTGTSGALTITDCVFKNTASVTLTSACTLLSSDIETETLIQGTSDLSGGMITTTSASGVATLSDPTFGSTTGLFDTEFSQGNAGHAIEIDTAGTYDFVGLTFSGYGVDATNSAALYVSETIGTVTINVTGGGNSPTVRTAGATVEIINNPVTIQVTCTNSIGTAVSGVRVLLETAGVGPYPYQGAATLTQSAGTATATHTAHNLATNDYVVISGANEAGYNGAQQITVTGANSYTYSVDAGTASPATGTILVNYAPLSAVTAGTGIVTTTKVFTSDQAVSGVARKGTSAPLYKTAPISGTISSTLGLTQTAVMISDE